MKQSPEPGPARKILLVGILISALALRLYGIDWDKGYLFHPDERAILMKIGELSAGADWPPDLGLLLDPKASPLNPHWFPYGSFPLYLLKGVAHLLAYFQPSFSGPDLRLVGRTLSALFDMGSVALTYSLGAGLYGPGVGLGAAALVAFAVLHIQLSHFYAVDTLLTFFVLLALWGAMGTARKGSLLWGAVAGLALGLGLATKVSMAPMVITVLVAHALYILHPPEGSEDSGVRINRALRSLVLVGVVGGLAFFLAEPYAIIDWGTFQAQVAEQSEMVRRVRDYPYTRQYVGTAPYLYHIQQLATWGMGLPMGLLGWVGFLFIFLRGLIRRRPADLLVLSWAFPYFALTGAFPVKFMRYMLPLTPLLAVMGTEMLMAWRGRAMSNPPSPFPLPSRERVRVRVPPWLPGVIFAGVLVASAIYALAYLGIYSRPHPAVVAAAWIKAHVPPGQSLAREHWEESLPGLEGYPEIMLNLYEPDGPGKLDHIVLGLSKADYLVFYSNRLYGTILRLPERYPLTSWYYRLLFSGKLGFELEAFFSSYPTLGPFALVDDTFARPGLSFPGPLDSYRPALLSLNLGYADESFTVYDHPLVMVFKKKEAFSVGDLKALLDAGLPSAGANRPVGLLLSEEEAARQRAGGTWSELFQRESLANRFPLLSWLLEVELLSLAALPITLGLFRALPDRGYILVKGMGLLLPAYFSWLFASLRLIPFTGASVLLGAGLVGLASAYYLRYPPRRRVIWSYLRERWRLLAFEEGLFLIAFFFFFWVRLLNPDLWHPWRGGEKPMDFAFLNAMVKSTFMPPYDPWFSGGYINYYYFGHFIVASLIKLTGILPSVAYNLAVPLLFALAASAAFSVAYNLAEAARGPAFFFHGFGGGERDGTLNNWSSVGALSRVSPVLAGVGGALAVVFLGNLDGAAQVLDGLGKIGGVRYESTIPGLSGLLSALGGLWQLVWEGRAMPPLDYWRSSRMMPPTISITEFPYFTFLFADLHAHLIALPFTLLAVGIALNLALGSGGLFRLGSLALVLGALRWINSWDFPTYFLLGWAALLIGEVGRRRRVDRALIGWVILKGAFVFGLSFLFYLPLQRSYQLFYLGIQPSPERTPLHQYLQIHGLFLFVLASFLGYRLYGVAREVGPFRWASLAARYWWNIPHLLALKGLLVRRSEPLSTGALYYMGAVGVLALVLWLAGIPTGAFLLLLLALALPLAIWEALGEADEDSRWAAPCHLFILALVGLAAGIGLVVEAVALQGDINRMNTVFKFYLQAWVLYGLAAAYAFWWLLAGAAPSAQRISPLLRRVWLGCFAVLVAGSLVYPLAATPVRVGDRFGSLPMTNDGMAFMEKAVYRDEKGDIELAWDYEAIRWLQDNVLGSPVILEGVTPLYRWGSRISVYTGLPTVIGWDWHETQQRLRYQYMVEERLRNVREIFTTTSPEAAMALLDKYQVSYIIVGRLERLYYPRGGLDKFRGMTGTGYLSLVYQNPQVEIYAVRRE